ncbi:hypothetical protein SAMN04487939_101204 [Lysobacter sp. yr284]|uniref:hypothetical protein n=1 Tax=Lysobacter TaxID=68 RepID=UPI0008949A09|nr:hypothetical protein [Lysobacter sp. yr284]SDY20032.1 hypothetical protein SAMN04487939_101204 [Lysobacter sp. yr284]
MNQTTTQRLSILPLALAVVVAGAAALAPVPAQAFYASEITQVLNKVQLQAQNMKLVQQLTELRNQVTQLKAQFDQLNPGNFQLGSLTGFRDKESQELSERLPAASYGLDESCQKGKSSVADDQYKVCAKRVEISNLRFNAMVKMLKEVKKRDEQIEKLMNDRKTLTGPENKGKLDANTNQVMQLQAQMENDIQNGKTTLDTYTTILQTLDDDMVALAQRALTNKPGGKGWLSSMAGAAVQGIALKAGLKAAESRDL